METLMSSEFYDRDLEAAINESFLSLDKILASDSNKMEL